MTLKTVMESITGRASPVNYDGLQQLFNDARPKLFPGFSTYDPAHAIPLSNLIMGRFLNREICETPYAKWQFMFTQRLNEIMPYYNQLFQSVEMIPPEDIFNDVNYQRSLTDTKEGTSTKSENEKISSESTMTSDSTYAPNVTSISTSINTPQSEITDFLDNKYLNSASKTWNDGDDITVNSGESKGSGSTERIGKQNDSSTSNIAEQYKGKKSGTPYIMLLKEYRQQILNIDMMIIEELEDLFFMVY